MGSPVSAVIANMVMEDVEQRALATSPVKPFFWKRYVDDVISAVSGNEAERLLSHLNSVEPSIQFTLEREKDRHLPFLDLNVSRGVQGNLETSVYRKPTHTDKYLAFDSHHPICHKKSVAKTLLRRADCLPSSLDSKAEERKYVSNVLKANGYTKTFLRNCKNQVQLVALLMKGNQRMVLLLFLTFRVLRNPSRELWIATTLKLLKNPPQTLGRIFAKPKDPVTKNNKPTLLILFPCNDYDHDYIGQTKRQFGTLLKEHQKAVFFAKMKIQLCRSIHA